MKAMGIIFSNIFESALEQLTSVRTLASLPFGSRYRLIDFTLSDMSNSGIYKVGIITKYNYRSLMDHLGNCSEWDLNRKNEGVVMLPPFAEGNTGVYKGKLEALYNASHFIAAPGYDYVVICDSPVVCNIDFRPAIEQHIRTHSDVTAICTKEGPDAAGKRPMTMQLGEDNIVTNLRTDAEINPDYYTGMGMFIIGKDDLLKVLEEAHEIGVTHFEKDYMQRKYTDDSIKISAYIHEGTVLQNLDIKSYYRNNMMLLDKEVRDDLFKLDFPIYTKVHDEAPSYYVKGSEVENSLIADGCLIKGRVEGSVLFREVTVEEGANVSSSIIMQSAKIGKHAELRNVILDKDVTVGDYTVLIGTKEHPVIIPKGETV